jgi:ATP-dependent Clp protease adaptor protein ClpS
MAAGNGDLHVPDRPAPTPVKGPSTDRQDEPALPPMYCVWLWNNPTTNALLVVEVLAAVFRLDESRAFDIMFVAHHHDRAEVGVFPKDLAETLAQQAVDAARRVGDQALAFTTERA